MLGLIVATRAATGYPAMVQPHRLLRFLLPALLHATKPTNVSGQCPPSCRKECAPPTCGPKCCAYWAAHSKGAKLPRVEGTTTNTDVVVMEKSNPVNYSEFSEAAAEAVMSNMEGCPAPVQEDVPSCAQYWRKSSVKRKDVKVVLISMFRRTTPADLRRFIEYHLLLGVERVVRTTRCCPAAPTALGCTTRTASSPLVPAVAGAHRQQLRQGGGEGGGRARALRES